MKITRKRSTSMGFKTISAISRGKFLIDPAYAQDHIPLIQSILNGTRAIEDIEDPGDDEFFSSEGESTENVNNVAVLSISGPIMHYGGMCSYGSEDWAKKIAALDADTTVGSIVLKIDSPGGQVDGTQTLVNAIKNCNKPVLAFINDGMAASAAYWIASAADEIYCGLSTDVVGSIGVLCTMMDARKFLEDNGIKQIAIYAPQSTDKNKIYRDALDGDTKGIEAELKYICDAFINGVTVNRGAKLTSTAWNTGACYFASDAQKLGLVDGLQSFNWVVKRAASLSQTSPQNNNANTSTRNMGIFGSDFPKLNALKGKEASAITAEEITAVNEELSAKGMDNLVVISSAHFAEANTTADASTNALINLNLALGKEPKTNLADAVAAIVADRNAEHDRAETYGKQPGAKPSKPASNAPSEGGEQAAEKKPNFYTSVDAEVAAMFKD